MNWEIIIGILLVTGGVSYLVYENFEGDKISILNDRVIGLSEFTERSLIIGVGDEKNKEEYWKIRKSGAEEDLHVSYNIINSTTTEFCISHLNKGKYINSTNRDGNDAKEVPLAETKNSKIFNISENKIDVSTISSNGEDCFNVNYDEFVEGIQFRIGWNSVLVESSTTSRNLETAGANNMVRLDNGDLIGLATDGSSDFLCMNSSDDGTTWTTTALTESDDFFFTNIATNGTRLYIVGEDSPANDIMYTYSDTGCTGMVGATDITDMTVGYTQPSLEYNGDTDEWIMCVQNGDGDLIFANSSAVGINDWNQTELGTASYSGGCGLSIDSSDGEIWIAAVDTAGNDMKLFNSSDNYESYNDTQISSASITDGEASISANNGYIAVASAIDPGNLYAWYSSDGGTSFTELTNSNYNYYRPQVCLDEQDVAQMIFINDTTGDWVIEHTNFTTTFGVYGEIEAVGSRNFERLGMLCHGYPAGNRMDLELIESLALLGPGGDDIYFFNHTYYITPVVTSCDYESGNWEISDACELNYTTLNITGNLTLENGGSLTLNNATINFNDSNQWIVFDNLASGDKLILEGNSTIN